MTPLAHQVLKQLLLPVRRREFVDRGDILPHMDDVHYFDCRSVGGIASELAYSERFDELREKTSFLPALKTWIEVKLWDMDIGFLLISGPEHVKVWTVMRGIDVAYRGESQFRSSNSIQHLPMRRSEFAKADIIDFSAWKDFKGFDDITSEWATVFSHAVIGSLMLINSPRAIDRQLYEPHAGLKRQLEQSAKGDRKFKLHRWTKILLKLEPGRRGASHDHTDGVHLTAGRAKHFVRKYLRTRNGELERVSEHWKGDAALGLKLSTYRVAPPSLEDNE